MKNDLEYIERDDMYEIFSEKLSPKPLLHKCKDGKIFCLNYNFKKYPQIEDSHLINILHFIEKNATKYAEDNVASVDSVVLFNMYQCLSGVQGEMAIYALEDEINNYLYEGNSYQELIIEYLKVKHYDEYLKEATKRDLQFTSKIDWNKYDTKIDI